jgi:hypothetical protein
MDEPQRMDGGFIALGGFLRQLIAFGWDSLPSAKSHHIERGQFVTGFLW